MLFNPDADPLWSLRPTVYLGGPMRGKPQYNFPAFMEAEEYINSLGYNVVNPADHDLGVGVEPLEGVDDKLRGELLLWDFTQIVRHCQAIYLLRGWQQSEGATLEYLLAKTLGMPIYQQGQDELPDLIVSCRVN
jgi:hypothetical protein